jgi:amino acid adenylation domain-containing protein
MLSYKELHALSDKLSSTIRNILARSSRRKTVPILLPQCSSLYVILLSILKAGAAFVPLNLDAPDERIRFVVDDVDAGVIVTSSSFRDKFGWPGAPEVLIVDDYEITDQTSGGLVEEGIHSPLYTLPSNAAYIMYTSGSTGKPKGVTISHSAVTQSLLAHDRHIPRFRRFLQFAAPTFDVSVFEIFFCFFRGSTLVGCDRGRLLADLPGVINELEVDAAELTPTVAGEILGERDALPGLKVLLTIGEMLTRQVVDRFGNGLLHGMYGPTEAAIHCTLATDFRKEVKVGNVGVPLDTVSAFIVAPQSDLGGIDVEVLPLGWVGELAVGGWQLADGYINRPDLTKEAFVDSSRWGRLYRTGDRARILPSGSIECLGRVSAGQVKIRGQRAELGEIEEVVLKAQDAKAAVASVINGNLVVHISTAGRTSKDAVRAVCRRWLPGFMVPSDVVIFEDLPRLPSGKADRKQLEEDYSERVRDAAEQHENMDDVEQIVTRNIEELLCLRPRRDESLVSLGLDSIQAIKLGSLLRGEGLRVEVLDVVKSDTVAGIASIVNIRPDVSSTVTEEVRAHLSAVRVHGLSKISPELHRDVEAVIPCTSLQEALIAETVRDPRVYCNWILLDLPSTVDAVQVEAAFRAIVQRNEILRTGFIPIGDGFAQVIWKTSRSWQFSRVKSVEPSWKLSLEDMLEPPFMGEHLENESGAERLSVRIHHALYDGWSWEHIVSDFQSLLARDDLLPQRPQFRDFVRWELGISPKSAESTRAFWQSTLKDAGGTKLPNFHGRHDVKSGVIVEGRQLSASRSVFEGCARSTGVSSQVLVQSAWAYLLSSYIGKGDIVFGTVVSGRAISLDHVEDIIGPMIRTLPVRVQVGLDRSVSDLLLDVHAFNMKLLEHAELGLREIKKACGDDCVFDSLLVWQQTTNDKRGGTVKVSDSQDNLEVSFLAAVVMEYIYTKICSVLAADRGRTSRH